MTLETLYTTVLEPFCCPSVYVIVEDENETSLYQGYPREKQMYAYLLVRQVKEIYVGADTLVVVVH